MTKQELEKDAKPKLKVVKEITSNLPASEKKTLGMRNVFDNSFVREISFLNGRPIAFMEAKDGTPKTTVLLNFAILPSAKNKITHLHQLFENVRSKLIADYDGKVKELIVSVSLNNPEEINFFNSLGFKLINDRASLMRNRLSTEGQIAHLFLKI